MACDSCARGWFRPCGGRGFIGWHVIGRLTFWRDADWLDGGRAKAWRNVLLVLTVGIATGWTLLARDGVDITGKPLGTDFTSFYAASRLVLAGRPEAVYDVDVHAETEVGLFDRDLGYAAFLYPPVYLLVCAPLALLPYLGALAMWLGVTGACFAASLAGWLDRRLGFLSLAAFPAVLINAAHGQNAFLSAALMATGALFLKKRPILAGVAFGMLAFKPHLAILIPLALIVAGRWRTLIAASATALALTAASLAVFGAATWHGFLVNSPLARATLELGLVDPAKMVSVFAGVRVLGGPVALAYAVQALVVVAVMSILVRVVRSRPDARAEGALIVLASTLASPFLLDYDLALLAVPLAWLAGEGLKTGFRPWEKTTLLAAYALPLVARGLATGLHLPVAPLVIGALLVLVARRALASQGAQAELPNEKALLPST
jgi:hypothetical protein